VNRVGLGEELACLDLGLGTAEDVNRVGLGEGLACLDLGLATAGVSAMLSNRSVASNSAERAASATARKRLGDALAARIDDKPGPAAKVEPWRREESEGEEGEQVCRDGQSRV
jgi:hypothetical protein